jgi:hypothetical protein
MQVVEGGVAAAVDRRGISFKKRSGGRAGSA